MVISLEIPKEFEEHFNMDRFKDSLERVYAGAMEESVLIAGFYDLEVIKMLKDSLIRAEVIKE